MSSSDSFPVSCWIEKGAENTCSFGRGKRKKKFIDEAGYTLYILMEFCPENLDAIIFGKQQTTLSQRLDYGKQLFAGLAYIHAMNIVHMDISHENILVDSSGQIKITDFRFAHEFKPNEEIRTRLFGQYLYRAPELQGYTPLVTPKVDVYAAGLVLLSLLHPMRSKRGRKRTFEKVKDKSYVKNVAFNFLIPFLEDVNHRASAEAAAPLLCPNDETMKELEVEFDYYK